MHILYVFIGLLFFFQKPPAYIKKKLEEQAIAEKAFNERALVEKIENNY